MHMASFDLHRFRACVFISDEDSEVQGLSKLHRITQLANVSAKIWTWLHSSSGEGGTQCPFVFLNFNLLVHVCSIWCFHSLQQVGTLYTAHLYVFSSPFPSLHPFTLLLIAFLFFSVLSMFAVHDVYIPCVELVHVYKTSQFLLCGAATIYTMGHTWAKGQCQDAEEWPLVLRRCLALA